MGDGWRRAKRLTRAAGHVERQHEHNNPKDGHGQSESEADLEQLPGGVRRARDLVAAGRFRQGHVAMFFVAVRLEAAALLAVLGPRVIDCAQGAT